jgi:hypothetical protein
MRTVKSTAAAIGLMVVIITLSFTLSLAQDTASSLTSYSSGLQRSLPIQASPQSGGDMRVGFIPKPGILSLGSQDVTNATGFVPRNSSAIGSKVPSPAWTKARKIALHLLDSILLI